MSRISVCLWKTVQLTTRIASSGFLVDLTTKFGWYYNYKKKIITASVICLFFSFFSNNIGRKWYVFNIRLYTRKICRIIGTSHSRDIFPRKYPKRKDVRYFPFQEGNWKTSYFRGWIPDELLLKGLPLVSIRRVQGYFCKGGGGSLVLPKSE